MFSTEAITEVTSGQAWVRAMLRFEAALARAEARAGLVPAEAAAEIAQACAKTGIDPVVLGREARLSGNPAVALVARLRALLAPETAGYAHLGATSQDVVDTAAMLVLRRAGALVGGDVARLCRGCAGLAERYRSTPMAGRTLLQQACPTTFGAKAAGWLMGALSASEELTRADKDALAVQLGGPVGTLDALGDRGPEVVAALAAELGLAHPVTSWHTERSRMVQWSCALVMTAGAAAKVALDVALLMQSEVAEVAEPAARGRGGSSSMPHKRNPAMSVTVQAAWRAAQHQHGVVVGSMAGEHERAAGAWQAEAHALNELCRATAAAAAMAADIVAGLEVDTARMRSNLDGTGTTGQPDEALSAQVVAAQAVVDAALGRYRRWEAGRAGQVTHG